MTTRWVKQFFISASVALKNSRIFQNESSHSSVKESEFADNRSKRFDFLLKQTEIFSHFMPGGTSKITPEKKKKPGKKPATEADTSTSKLDTSDPAE